MILKLTSPEEKLKEEKKRNLLSSNILVKFEVPLGLNYTYILFNPHL